MKGRAVSDRCRSGTRAFIAGLAMALASLGMAHAQEPPPPAPVGLRLVEHAPGGYRLEVRDAGAIVPYEVTAFTSRIGTDQGVVARIAWTDGEDQLLINLSLPLDGMNQEGCYSVRFSVQGAEESGKPREPFDAGASLGAYGCVDASGRTTFPGIDAIFTPPPTPPSDVRMVPQGEGAWAIEWRDNSDNEIAFDPGILLFERPWPAESGASYGGIDLPLVPANATSAGAVNFFFTPDDAPAEPTCGYALVLVFAVGPDAVSPWAGNTTVPACFSKGEISFPATGAGDPRDPGNLTMLAAMLMGCGAALAVGGTALRRRAMRLHRGLRPVR